MPKEKNITVLAKEKLLCTVKGIFKKSYCKRVKCNCCTLVGCETNVDSLLLIPLQERDKIICWTNLIDIFCGLTFYPLEHIAWARDKKLLPGKSAKLWDLGLYCWIGSLIACIIRDLWLLKKLQHQISKSVSK